MSKKLRCIKEAHRAGKGRIEHQNSGRRHVGPLALSTGDPAVLRLVAQLCLTLCDPMDYSLPGTSVRRISQARILECTVLDILELDNTGVAISFSRESS